MNVKLLMQIFVRSFAKINNNVSFRCSTSLYSNSFNFLIPNFCCVNLLQFGGYSRDFL